MRCIWDLLYDQASGEAVAAAERAADGVATEDETGCASWSAEGPTFGYDFEPQFIRQYMAGGNYDQGVRRLLEMGVYTEAAIAGDGPLGDGRVVQRLTNAAHIAYHLIGHVGDDGLSEHMLGHLSSQAEWPGGWLVREVFGNPFHPAAAAPEWRTETVVAIARTTYAERAFNRLPVLADALEEAGCVEAELLAHCRGPGPHVLGCWALDLAFGMSTESGAAPAERPQDKQK